MRISKLYVLTISAFAAACGGSGATDSSTSPANTVSADPAHAVPGDEQIAALVYDNAYSVPSGFFVDERSDTDRSYTVHHVLDASSSYELCSDDYAVALAWEAEDNAARNVQGYYVESYDNERYFEFVRELAYENDVGNVDDITSPGFARVFKCGNTDRTGVDRSVLTGYAGTINAQPLDPNSIRVFTEYLWQFAFFPANRKKVIDSYGTETEHALQQTLVLAIATNQGASRCDRVEVAEWQFSVDRVSGEVSKVFTTVRTFEATLENGLVRVCI